MVWSVAIKIKQLLHSQAETDLGQNSTETTVTILDASTQACVMCFKCAKEHVR